MKFLKDLKNLKGKKKIEKGKIVVTITIGIMCFILTYVMLIQFRTIEQTDITSIESMREDELRTQLASWKSKYEETQAQLEDTQSKIQEYQEKTANSQNAAEVLDQELTQSNILVGKTDVEGEGIEITLKDGEYSVTATDLIRLVNELRLAEAEAISINDERVINLTDIVDVSSFVVVNGQRLSSPFVIKAIGNQKYLESGLTAKGGFLDTIQDEGKEMVITPSKNITITKYNGEIKLTQVQEN